MDSKPEHLVQSGMMGSIYAEYVLGMQNPRVGLLNIGEEPSKGNEQALATFPLLSELKTINFIGGIYQNSLKKSRLVSKSAFEGLRPNLL